MNIKYFKYLFRSTLKTNIIMFLIMFMMFPLLVLFQDAGTSTTIVNNITFTFNIPTDTKLYMATISMMVMAYVLPIGLHHIFHDKKALDSHLSIPVKNWQVTSTSMAFGLIDLFATWSLVFFLGLSASAIKQMPLNYAYYIAYFGTMLLIGGFAYMLSYLVTSITNSLIDTMLLEIIVFVLPFVIMAFLSSFSGGIISSSSPLYFQPVYLADSLTSFFQGKSVVYPEGLINLWDLEGQYNYYYYISSAYSWSVYYTIALSSLAVLIPSFGYLTILQMKHYKAEDAETVTRYPYSFRLFVPILATLLFAITSPTNSFGIWLIFTVIISISYFVGWFAINRKVGFNKEMLIMFGVSLVLGTAISYIYQAIITAQTINP